MAAILFGSISTIADTSELQRKAFNDAFQAHGLSWRWDRDDYLAMLEESGGQDRITHYASTQGEQVDAEAIHRSKSELFQKSLSASAVAPRQGVVETVQEAKSNGIRVALVTTTSEANVTSLLDALAPAVQRTDFDLVVDSSTVAEPKPDRASYVFAIESLGERPEACIAIEDNRGGVQAAAAAGLRCIAFPNENTAAHDFDDADRRVDRIDFAQLQQLIGA